MEKRLNRTRRARTKANVLRTYPFSACALSLNDDLNIHLIFRSLANFSGQEFFVIGAKNWFQGATNGLKEIIKITYFKNINEFLTYIKQTDYKLIAIEQSDKSVNMENFIYPNKCCFIFGNESSGLPEEILLHSY